MTLAEILGNIIQHIYIDEDVRAELLAAVNPLVVRVSTDEQGNSVFDFHGNLEIK